MDLGLTGKKALVLGSSQGIGAEIARVLAREGCDVSLGARRLDNIQSLADELSEEFNIDAKAYPIDLSDGISVEKLCEMITHEWKIDILLNNAGGPPPSFSTGVPDEIWESSLQSLLMSTIRLSEAAVKGMRERGWGRILTVASSGVIQPIPNLAVSNTVRSAVVGFTKTLSNEVAKDGITVNMLLPGRIDTERLASIHEASANKQGMTYEEFEIIRDLRFLLVVLEL